MHRAHAARARTMPPIKLRLVGTIAGLLLAGVGWADEPGKAGYMHSCASRHGESGAGYGPLAQIKIVPLPPVTGLAATNDCEFPTNAVLISIDGHRRTRRHGYPMPVWVKRFHRDTGGACALAQEEQMCGRVLSNACY